MQLRVATAQDAEAITTLINSAFRPAEGFLLDRDRIDTETVRSLQKKGHFVVAEDGADVAGCVYLELRGDRAYLGLLSVDPKRQKAGIGSMLMEHAEDQCSEAGCRFMDLRIINLRKDNHAFYSRRGYIETGTEPFPADLKPRLPCHFVSMSKPLGKSSRK
jgi:N-acetylglutamate synthase-like GNAT family acetyltransferase